METKEDSKNSPFYGSLNSFEQHRHDKECSTEEVFAPLSLDDIHLTKAPIVARSKTSYPK